MHRHVPHTMTWGCIGLSSLINLTFICIKYENCHTEAIVEYCSRAYLERRRRKKRERNSKILNHTNYTYMSHLFKEYFN